MTELNLTPAKRNCDGQPSLAPATPDALIVAFVQGAKWWEYHQTKTKLKAMPKKWLAMALWASHRTPRDEPPATNDYEKPEIQSE
jgi:hypothetical protein